MLLPNVLAWFGLTAAVDAGMPVRAPHPDHYLAGSLVEPLPAGYEGSLWTPARLEVADGLWGKGFQFPGGEVETLHLAKPLGLSAASSLLLLGAGGGGPPCCIANKLGVWVTGFEADPGLVVAATE